MPMTPTVITLIVFMLGLSAIATTFILDRTFATLRAVRNTHRKPLD